MTAHAGRLSPPKGAPADFVRDPVASGRTAGHTGSALEPMETAA